MKKYGVLVSIAAIALVGSLVLGCTAKTGPSAASQTATVQRGNLNINILASGNLVTSHEENLSFYSAGTVQQVLVKVGDRVKTGQALAKLDTAPLQSALAQAGIGVKQAQMDLENAEEPKTNSSGTQVISAPDPLNIEIKELQLQNAKDNETEAQKKLDKATIVAPFDGLVTDVNVVVGDQVAANAVGVRIIDPANFQVDVLVSEMEIYEITLGTPATVQAVSLPTYTFPARIALVAESPTITSNVVNYKVTVQMDTVTPALMQAQASSRTAARPGTGSVRTRVPGAGGQIPGMQPGATDNQSGARRFPMGQPTDNQTAGRPPFTGRQFPGQTSPSISDNRTGQQQAPAATTTAQDLRLREGLTVTVSIIAEQKNDILLVPNKAITSRGGRYYVQLISAPGKTEEKMIQAGTTDGQNTEVVSGLAEGDLVSTATNITATTTTTGSQQRPGGIPGGGIPGVPFGR